MYEQGRKGGSPVAVAIVNALIILGKEFSYVRQPGLLRLP